MYLYPLFGAKVHPPRAFAIPKIKIACGRCTLTSVSGAKCICQNHPFGNHPFANPRIVGVPGKELRGTQKTNGKMNSKRERENMHVWAKGYNISAFSLLEDVSLYECIPKTYLRLSPPVFAIFFGLPFIPLLTSFSAFLVSLSLSLSVSSPSLCFLSLSLFPPPSLCFCFPLSVFLSLFSSLCFPLSVFLSLFSSLCFPLSVFLSLFSSLCFPLSLVSLSLYIFPLSLPPSRYQSGDKESSRQQKMTCGTLSKIGHSWA